MLALNLPKGIKPFCPVHHWRMAHDAGSSRVSPSYRCSYDGCTLRYTLEEGYFEAGSPASDRQLLSHVENITCKVDREHRPCIVSYAKESNGDQTEEWRQWQCFAEDCDFTVRQKLSSANAGKQQAASPACQHSWSAQHEHALSKK
jgi:hypothetical protein